MTTFHEDEVLLTSASSINSTIATPTMSASSHFSIDPSQQTTTHKLTSPAAATEASDHRALATEFTKLSLDSDDTTTTTSAAAAAATTTTTVNVSRTEKQSAFAAPKPPVVLLSEDSGPFPVGATSAKGRPYQNEDRHFARVVAITPGEQWLVAGVFDGHGGQLAATFCEQHFLRVLLDQPEVHRLQRQRPRSNEALEDALRRSFLRCDEEFLAKDRHTGLSAKTPCPQGCAALVAILHSGGQLTVGNAGDCRAVISRRGQALPLSRDHRPTVPEERERILRAGARVAGPHGKYVMLPRREVGLSLSRSIGDRLFKECNGAVVATPDVITITISPGDEFLLLGCDGLWDHMSNDEAISTVHRDLEACTEISTETLTRIAANLVFKAIVRGSNDNVTVLIIPLKTF